MKKRTLLFISITLLILTSFVIYQKNEIDTTKKDYEIVQDDQNYKIDESRLLIYEVNPKKQQLDFYWKDSAGKNYKNFRVLKKSLQKENKELIFAMNGGMFKRNLSPQGLFIDNGITRFETDTIQEGYGNFYMQPNGIFYLTKENNPVVCTTKDFLKKEHKQTIKYATQSGPMLLIDGQIHSKFKKESSNLNIRNGVGILPNGNILFAMSKEEINFYDLATFFKQKGCKNALYLDGFVSKTYLPSQNCEQTNGTFGVIIAETK